VLVCQNDFSSDKIPLLLLSAAGQGGTIGTGVQQVRLPAYWASGLAHIIRILMYNEPSHMVAKLKHGAMLVRLSPKRPSNQNCWSCPDEALFNLVRPASLDTTTTDSGNAHAMLASLPIITRARYCSTTDVPDAFEVVVPACDGCYSTMEKVRIPPLSTPVR
jgi:hypothetical protein